MGLKLKQNYEEMRSMVLRWDRERVQAGHPGFAKTAAEYRERQLSPRRFRGDLLRAAIGTTYVTESLYPLGVDDDHIDSAMRHICKDITDDKAHWAAQK